MSDRLRFSHVCRHWRQTALTFPSLWSTISARTIDNECALEFLRRSKRVDLRVYDELQFPHLLMPTRWLDSLVSRSRRLVELHVLTSHGYNHLQSQLFQSPAPKLEALSLWTGPAGSLPQIFAGHVPKLRKLALVDCTSWQGNNFSTLRHLFLRSQTSLDRCTIHEFLDMLKELPQLEELALIDAGPLEKPEDVSGVDCHPVILKNLRRIEIGCALTSRMPSVLLSYLAAPDLAELSVWERLPHYRLGGAGVRSTMLPIVLDIAARHWRESLSPTQIFVTNFDHHYFISAQRSRIILANSMLQEPFLIPLKLGWFPHGVDELCPISRHAKIAGCNGEICGALRASHSEAQTISIRVVGECCFIGRCNGCRSRQCRRRVGG